MTSEETFVKSLKEVEYVLTRMQFTESFFEEKGHARFIHYRKGNITVKFLFGPPEWHVEMIIITPKGYYSFSDLVRLPFVVDWMKNNKPAMELEKEKNIKAEILWFISLLEFVLPFLE